MIERNAYVEQLKQFVNKPLIKILTGIRRSGKSSALILLKKELQKLNVDESQIVFINFESFAFNDLRSSDALYKYISTRIVKGKKSYLLLDEIQEVKEWEKAINAFLVDFDVDIYLTGSNSHLLSSELSTYIAGRYVEIPVYTLSFAEFLSFRKVYSQEEKHLSINEQFLRYLSFGGFPILHTGDYSPEVAYRIVYDIYSSVVLRDTVQRYAIRDIELLERIIKYAFNNLGNTFSGKNVADYFKSQQRKMDVNTVYNYLNALEGAFILYRVPRYNIKGKEILKTQEKFYLSDIGLLYATMGFSNQLISGILENLVFLALKRAGYKVYVGKLADKEIDFIAERGNDKIYVQVAYKLDNENTVEREFNNLLTIKDQYPKYVVSMDDFWKESVQGIKHYYIADFLLEIEKAQSSGI